MNCRLRSPLLRLLLVLVFALPLLAGCEGGANDPLLNDDEAIVAFRLKNDSTSNTHLWVGEASQIGPDNRVTPGGTREQSMTIRGRGSTQELFTLFAGRNGSVLKQSSIQLTVTGGESRTVDVTWNEANQTLTHQVR